MTRRRSERTTETVIGKKIRQLRMLSGLNQTELAAQLGLHQAALSRIEKGKQRLTPSQLQEIADVLGVDMNQLFEREEG